MCNTVWNLQQDLHDCSGLCQAICVVKFSKTCTTHSSIPNQGVVVNYSVHVSGLVSGY